MIRYAHNPQYYYYYTTTRYYLLLLLNVRPSGWIWVFVYINVNEHMMPSENVFSTNKKKKERIRRWGNTLNGFFFSRLIPFYSFTSAFIYLFFNLCLNKLILIGIELWIVGVYFETGMSELSVSFRYIKRMLMVAYKRGGIKCKQFIQNYHLK